MNTSDAERPLRSERKARGSGHLRRAELLAAAERIFTVDGYEGATIRKIAEEVGVSSTALYMYFQDKSQIMLEICVHALEAHKAELDRISEQDAPADVRLRAMMEAMLAFGFGQTTAYQLLYCVVPKDLNERRNVAIAPLNRDCFRRVLVTVEEAIATGRFRADLSPRPTAEAIVGACHGALAMRIANPNAPWTEPEVLSRTLLDALFRGFKAA